MSTLSNWAGIESARFTDGAMHVASVGVSGSVATHTLVAAAAAGSGDAANQYITSATGWKYAKVVPVSDVAIAADQLLMVGWSSSASVQATVTGVLDSLRIALGTPDGVGLSNVIVSASIDDLPVIVWDGTTTIKTISVASQGTVDYDVAVITIS